MKRQSREDGAQTRLRHVRSHHPSSKKAAVWDFNRTVREMWRELRASREEEPTSRS
jgi:hypothetical protein